MKSSAIVFCFLLMASLFVRAQSPDEEIARAVMASPAAMVADAMVIRFSDDGSHETLREGSNGLVCYDRSNEPGRGFSAQCTSTGNLARAAQNHKVRMASNNADEVRSMFESQESDGSREAPEFGSVWYSVNGQDREAIRSAIRTAQMEIEKPSVIIGHNVIAPGCATMEGDHNTHGAPLPPEEISATKEKLNLDPNKFFHIHSSSIITGLILAI